MNNCQDYIIKMNQYLDGELPVEEISDLLRHMDECEECRKKYENLKIIAFETRHLRAETPRQLHANIMNAIAHERPIRRLRRLNRLGHLAALAACGALLVVMVNTVAPWLREKPLFGGSSNYSGEAADESMNMAPMAPQTAESAPEDAGGTERSLAADNDVAAMPAAAPGDAATAYDQNGEGENGLEKDQPDAASGGTQPGVLMQTAGYDHDLFTVPALRSSELVAWYIIATGTGDPSELFPMESVIGERELGETYIFVPNTASEKEDAGQTLIDAGFILHDNVDNLPEVDETAEYGLIVVFESR